MLISYFVAIVLVILATTTLWVVFKYRTKGSLVPFVLTPLLVFSAGFSWYGMNEVRGYAIPKHPPKESFLLYGFSQKPKIFLLIHNGEKTRYHVIPWSKKEEKKLAKAMEKVKKGIPIQIKKGNKTDEGEHKGKLKYYEFLPGGNESKDLQNR